MKILGLILAKIKLKDKNNSVALTCINIEADEVKIDHHALNICLKANQTSTSLSWKE